MNGVCSVTLRKSLVKWPCQKSVMRSANGVGVRNIQSSHHEIKFCGLIDFCCEASSAPASAGGSATGVSMSRSTVVLKPSLTDCWYSAGVAPNVARRRS